jgi:hypothetical protein
LKPKIAEYVPRQAWELLDLVRQTIDALPELIETPAFIMGVRLGPDIAISKMIPNCHVVARAFASFLPVEVQDGTVSVMGPDGETRVHKHSWLTLKGCDPLIILDPWPLGVVSGPALFLQDYAYHFSPEPPFPENQGEEFESQVEAVTNAMLIAVQHLWPARTDRAA